jgi:hypothetical protein
MKIFNNLSRIIYSKKYISSFFLNQSICKKKKHFLREKYRQILLFQIMMILPWIWIEFLMKL